MMIDRRRSTGPDQPPSSPIDDPSESILPPVSGQQNNVDIIALIRSLQRSAGVADCFRQGRVDCDEIDCQWRLYCLGLPARYPDGDLPDDEQATGHPAVK